MNGEKCGVTPLISLQISEKKGKHLALIGNL